MRRVAQRVYNRNAEHKYIDTQFTQSLTPSAITQLTRIQSGTDDITRVGDKVRLSTLRIRGQILAADATNAVRMVLFQWHPNTVAQVPSLAGLFQDPGNYNSFYQHDTGANFSVFYDKTYYLSANGTASIMFNKSFRLWSKKGRMRWVRQNLKFVGSSNDALDHLYILWFSDSNAAPSPGVQWYSRVSYTDG